MKINLVTHLIERIEEKMFSISPLIPFTKPYYIHKFVVRKRGSFKSVLEIGCGTGKHMSYLRESLRLGGVDLIVGLDIWLPYLILNKQNRTHDQFILGDACFLPFKEKSFDLVLALDLLEHISKKNGKKLLLDLDRVARQRIVLSLPIGWHPSHHLSNPYDEHVSAWFCDELCNMGYKLSTFYIRHAGGEFFENRLPSILKPLWLAIKVILGIVTNCIPNWAGYMVAYKEVN